MHIKRPSAPRLDNLVMAREGGVEAKAVLDWELSTLGHPIADLAYSAMPYHLPRESPGVQGLPNPRPAGRANLMNADLCLVLHFEITRLSTTAMRDLTRLH